MTQMTPSFLPGDDETLRTALRDVNTPNLLLVLATITGEDDWLKAPFLPAPIRSSFVLLYLFCVVVPHHQ